MKVFTKITGDVAVDKMINRMSDKTLKRILKRSLKKVATPVVQKVRQEIVTNGVDDTGAFKRSISKIKSKDGISVIVGAKHNIFNFPTLLEFGSERFDVDFKGRKIFDKVYNQIRNGLSRDIEQETIKIIQRLAKK